MNVHNELFNGVRQLRWQQFSPVVSTFSTSIRLLLVESNYELMTREPQKNCKKAFYDIFLL